MQEKLCDNAIFNFRERQVYGNFKTLACHETVHEIIYSVFYPCINSLARSAQFKLFPT